jgi:hypothetical protein
MKIRQRKFIGMIATPAVMTIYALVISAIGAIFVVGHGPYLELPFYVVAGLGWLPLVMPIIRWMSKPDPT